jgi:HAD superfamily hydrolase (TIGR01509 family)
MIKLIIFDAGGVLYKGNREIVDKAVSEFLKKHGVYDLKSSDEVWSKIEKLVSIGKISQTEAHKRWLAGVGLSEGLVDEWVEVDKKEIWSRFRTTPGINSLLRKLKKEYALVVLSDTIDNKQEKIEKMKIVGVDHRVFDEIFTSHDLGGCKPSKKVFWTVLKKFVVKPREALFISDACDELKGAKKIGLITIGFNCGCGDYKVKKLIEINEILRKIRLTKSTCLSL